MDILPLINFEIIFVTETTISGKSERNKNGVVLYPRHLPYMLKISSRSRKMLSISEEALSRIG
jgi:hypothetical protein